MNRTITPVVVYLMFWLDVIVVDSVAVLELHEEVLHLLLLIVSDVTSPSRHQFLLPRLGHGSSLLQ